MGEVCDWQVAQSRGCFVHFASRQVVNHLLVPNLYRNEDVVCYNERK